MKRPWPARCAAALFAMAPALPLCAAGQQPDSASRYQQFLLYPHRQAGFAALRAGDERTALAEFARARELAPQSIDTALDLAEAYRHFGHADKARAVLDEQRRYTPGDPRLRAPPADQAAVDCKVDNRPVCRAQRGFDALQGGDLAKAQRELDAADFARAPEGLALRRALIQRAIFLRDLPRAEAQLTALDQQGQLGAEERAQWFNLLLMQGRAIDARDLQARGGLGAPGQELAVALALSAAGERKALADYLAVHQPAFEEEKDERQWINLLAQVGRTRPELLDLYQARYPANGAWQARSALPLAMARQDDATAQRLLAHLPKDGYHEERFSLALAQGRYIEARQQAEALVAQPDGHRLLDPLSYRLMDAGAPGEAQRLLLASYPFGGNPHAGALFARLAVLASKQAAAFSADDRARLARPLENVPLRIAQVPILAALRDCDGIRQVMSDLSPDYPAELWRQLGDCYGSQRPGLAEYAYAEANKRKPDPDTTRALAYQAYGARDFATALQAWRSVPAGHMKPDDLLAAATTALGANEPAPARAWLDSYAEQGGRQDHAYWWLRAQADEPRDPALARTDLESAIAQHPDPRYYAKLAALQTQAGESKQALVSLQRAAVLAPDDDKLAAQLGYAYLQDGSPELAVTQFERAHRANPDDPKLTWQLLYVHQQLGDNAQARDYAEQAIDQLGAGTTGTDGAAQQDHAQDDNQQRFALRRLHEDLGRKWRFNADMTIGDTVSSAANAANPGQSYRSYFQMEGQYRFDPPWAGADINTLAAYARVFAGSGASGAVWPIHGWMLGVGLHWKPLTTQNIVLSVEQQTPVSGSRFTRNDTMLRAAGSWSFSPNLNDDWHAGGRGWWSQNFYVDVARYLRAKQTVFTTDYQLGWHHKLMEGQSIEPYARVQFTGIDRNHGSFQRDGRIGLGVQWNVWFGETRYDAYPHRVSVAVEGQHAFTSYLRDKNALFLIVRTAW